MKYIDEKFKDNSPEKTVEEIIKKLKEIGVELTETWADSGVENCYSLRVTAGKGGPGANGKGVTVPFARASGYGEFIERLQSGLFFYKHQSFEKDPEVDLQTYAPDSIFMTSDELERDAEWFDYLCEEYGVTRKQLAEQCEMYSHSDDGKIRCVPFYSVFEDCYVYLPTGFVEAIYSANGCCVGNTREEAMVHGLAEIMERKASIAAIVGGKAFPEMPEEVLKGFKVVSHILEQLRESGDLDVTVFDCSLGNGFPVISTRIIDKVNHRYVVNYAADPVLEIAVQRSLTEIFQGRKLQNFGKNRTKEILINPNEKRKATNVLNQLETGSGSFTVDYFANEITCDRAATSFEDNSGLNNKQLLEKTFKLFKSIGKPMYIRNCSFLDFPCYKIVIPGFSESRAMRLNEGVQEYALGDMVSKILRDPANATEEDLNILFMFNGLISGVASRENNFTYLSGVPIEGNEAHLLWWTTMAYCAYKTKAKDRFMSYLALLSDNAVIDEDDKQYFACVKQYYELKLKGVEKEKIISVINKFYKPKYVEKLLNSIGNGKTPFDSYILKCDGRSCENCKYKKDCGYEVCRKVIKSAGAVYKDFTDGQSKENFIIP